MHILVLISVFITVKSMDYAYEESDAWTDFDQDKGGSSFGWRSKNDTVLPYHGPENDKGQRSLQRLVSKAIQYRFCAGC